MLLSPEELAARMHRLREQCEKRDRDVESLEVTVFEYEPGGNRAESQALLSRYSEAGAHRVAVIQGLGDHTGSTEWGEWTPDRFDAELERVASRCV